MLLLGSTIVRRHSARVCLQQQQLFSACRRPICRSLSSFTWAGAKNLTEIVKKELLDGKTKPEISEIWSSYHDSKENIHGLSLNGQEGTTILKRAKESPFFIHPVFREDGFFMLLSQFQPENHFLMAYLEHYKTDPTTASPLITCSVFGDYADTLDLTLCRADVVNKTITDEEALKIVTQLLHVYQKDDEYQDLVHSFNHQSDKFDVDDYISRQNARWKS